MSTTTSLMTELSAWFAVWGLGIAGGAELLELNKPAVCPLRAPVKALKARWTGDNGPSGKTA